MSDDGTLPQDGDFWRFLGQAYACALEPLPYDPGVCHWCGRALAPESNVRYDEYARYHGRFDGRIWHAACEPALFHFLGNV